MLPMLATKGDRVPPGEAWAHEVKWDGMRVLVEVSEGGVRVFSRNENEATAAFPELQALAAPGRDLLLDGEVISLQETGPSFSALAERMHVRDATRAARLARISPVTLIVFDLLRLDGLDLTARPWAQRRALLEGVDLAAVSCQVPPAYDDGPTLLAAAKEQGLEGIVSKRRSSPYRAGQRSRDWLKFPIRHSDSFVVGGWRTETDSEHRLGALLVGTPTAQGLSFRGRVGSGLTGRAVRPLQEVLGVAATERNPFLEVPRLDAAGARWVEPVIVVDVEYLALTPEGRLRQPSYRGVRSDLTPRDLTADDLDPDEVN